MCLGITGVVTGITDDDGIPMAVIDTAVIDTAVIDTAVIESSSTGLTKACLLTCSDAAVGDTVLVHSGYVLRILDTAPAPAGAR